MKKEHGSLCRAAAAAVTAALVFASAVLPASAAGVSCTVQGKNITLPLQKTAQVISMEQSTVLDVSLKSASALHFHTADGKKLEVSTRKPFADGAATYSIYAKGSVNSAVGVYAEDATDSKLFVVQITDRPFTSDTTMDVSLKSGDSYTFRITPNSAKDYVTFYTTDGSVFSTKSAGKSTANGKTNYYFQFKALKSGSAGVYVTVGKQNYRVFTATSTGSAAPAGSTASAGRTGTVCVDDTLNLRAQPNTNGRVIGQLTNGETVTVLADAASGWIQVKTAAGLVGYCSSDYVQLDHATEVTNTGSSSDTPQTARVKTSGDALNLRAGSSSGSAVIGQLENGEAVTVLGTEGNWTYIQTSEGIKGYCSSDFLVAENSGGDSGETLGASKTLSGMPAYKQKDAAWANTYIGGTNGGTIGTIGCLVTSIAMSESYRTSSSVTPNDIAKQCQFTDGGGLYLPSGYYDMSGVSDSSLLKVFQQLQVDKPVLVGGVNSRSSHWVIIKGYKNVPLDSAGNPTALDASMFLVNDPGYDNYTLADYIGQFPSGRVFRTY